MKNLIFKPTTKSLSPKDLSLIEEEVALINDYIDQDVADEDDLKRLDSIQAKIKRSLVASRMHELGLQMVINLSLIETKKEVRTKLICIEGGAA